MTRYVLWVRVSSTQSTNTIVYADSFQMAKKLGEAQYGVGNVLSCREMTS